MCRRVSCSERGWLAQTRVTSRWLLCAQASTPEIKAIVVLDGNGQRICAKYYKKAEFPTKAKQVCAAGAAHSCAEFLPGWPDP